MTAVGHNIVGVRFIHGDIMTGATCGAGNAYLSGALDFTSGFHRGSCCPATCVSLFHVIVLSFEFWLFLLFDCLVSMFYLLVNLEHGYSYLFHEQDRAIFSMRQVTRFQTKSHFYYSLHANLIYFCQHCHSIIRHDDLTTAFMRQIYPVRSTLHPCLEIYYYLDPQCIL